ncbi:hypothetical protein F2Q68_00011420 [Brassica cretica]|uniref:Uncharacterized protein n=1 Tax=Brassica cretica TaxID=69181 RepID=A0A8S9L1U5_BRACR|nr:hypothetical protein F2Q68_00011420 [Brassica cretica]
MCRDNGRDSKESICDKWSHTSPSKPQSSDRQCAAEKWIALSFLHRLQQKVGQITDFAPVQQMCVTKPVLRVELAGDDGEYSDMFVVFYTKMTTIAAVINGQSLDELTGKQYLFQIRVTPYNFTPNHLTFTVSVITEDVAVKTHSRVKASTSPTSGMPE